jgi:hypothetical protein
MAGLQPNVCAWTALEDSPQNTKAIAARIILKTSVLRGLEELLLRAKVIAISEFSALPNVDPLATDKEFIQILFLRNGVISCDVQTQ